MGDVRSRFAVIVLVKALPKIEVRQNSPADEAGALAPLGCFDLA